MADRPLIGISGKAGSGKDTVADYLVGRGYEKVSFALPLKRALTAMFGVDFVDMDRDIKEKPLSPLQASPRRLMQSLGTEWGRDLIDPDIWVKALDMYIRQSQREYFVVPDVRFPNEVEWIRENGGFLIYLHRPSAAPVESHASENGVDPLDADAIVVNDGTIAQLQDRTLEALSKRGIYAESAPE